MRCHVVGADNIASLAARVFSVGERDDTARFEVREPDHNTTFTVRIIRMQKGLSSIMPFVVEGEVLEADGREWESFAAYFRLTANHMLDGSCTIGEFPDDLHP